MWTIVWAADSQKDSSLFISGNMAAIQCLCALIEVLYQSQDEFGDPFAAQLKPGVSLRQQPVALIINTIGISPQVPTHG